MEVGGVEVDGRENLGGRRLLVGGLGRGRPLGVRLPKRLDDRRLWRVVVVVVVVPEEGRRSGNRLVGDL